MGAEAHDLDPSERVSGGIELLIGQVQRMVEASGQAEGFDAAGWVVRWLERPLPALDGLASATFMDTSEGQQLVANLLSCAQTSAYA